jgi:hypothetical protein
MIAKAEMCVAAQAFAVGAVVALLAGCAPQGMIRSTSVQPPSGPCDPGTIIPGQGGWWVCQGRTGTHRRQCRLSGLCRRG